MNRSIPKDQEAEFIKRWESGELASDMACAFGCSRGSIYATVSRLSLTHRGRGRVAIGAHDEAEFTKRYLSDESVWSISQHFGCAEPTVWITALRLGLPVRPTGQPQRRFTNDDVVQILLQWDEGISMWELRRKWRVGHVPLIRLLQSHGRDTTVVVANKYISDGYMRIKLDTDDPMFCMAYARGYVLEHRLVMARSIGRPLDKKETVHHIDGNRLNNDISNLQLRNGRHGKGVVHKCLDCGSSNIESVPI